MISGSCKTTPSVLTSLSKFGNYVISGSCKTYNISQKKLTKFGNYVISGSCKTALMLPVSAIRVWELCDFWKL